MSQAGSTSGGGGGGGSSVTEIDTQSGNATPLLGVIKLNAYDTTENNSFGIETKGNTNGGNPPGTGTINETDVYLTNRFHGSVTTTDATPTTLAVCPMPLFPAVYQFSIFLCAYDSTNNLGASSVSTVTFRTRSAILSPVNLTPDDFIIQSDATFTGGAVINGSTTQMSVVVTGKAGTNIDWTCHGTYTVVN